MSNVTPFSVVFLAGGYGARMGSAIPKQYLCIQQKPLALYSFEVFLSLPEIQDVIVVCEPQYQSLFQTAAQAQGIKVRFALPGVRRQDSVYNGIQLLTGNPLVCVHDSARPLIDPSLVRRIVQAADHCGAAVVGVRVKSTIKVCDGAQMVMTTPDRNSLWEVQTPQIVRLALLQEGFQKAQQESLTVTDDVALVELIGKPVKVVEGAYHNIKVTTPEDLCLAEQLIDKQAVL